VKRIVFKMWLSENIHSLACFGSLVRERYVEILRFAKDDTRFLPFGARTDSSPA
jgi:hypothetical protein